MKICLARLPLFWLALLLVLPTSASAQEAPMENPDVEVARRHFERGAELYRQSNYPEAIAEFKAAHVAMPQPDFEYNIARCYDRLGDWGNALDYYQRYLAHAGPTDQTDEALARVAALKDRAPQEQEKSVTPPAPPPRRRLRLPAILVGVLALGALGAGGGLYGSAAADFPSRKSYCERLPRECVPSEWSDLQARANAGYALFAVGGVLVAADVVLWILDAAGARRSQARRASEFAGASF